MADTQPPEDPDHVGFPVGFFGRGDERPDRQFYEPLRLVTHIDDQAIEAVGTLYADLGIDGDAPRPTRVLDLMSSWISHFRVPPAELVVLGMNAQELAANEAATERLVHDLNVDPTLPFVEACSTPSPAACPSTTSSAPWTVAREIARGPAPGRRGRVHLQQPLLPGQGHPRLALLGRHHPPGHRAGVPRAGGRLRRAGDRAADAVASGRRSPLRRLGAATQRRLGDRGAPPYTPPE